MSDHPKLAAEVRARLPVLVRAVKRLYHFVGASAGTRFQELKWARRGPQEIARGRSSLDHPHRHVIVGHLARLGSWTSLLEVGSGYGPNLHHLAKRFPTAELYGIDINPLSVSMGSAWLREAGVGWVHLMVGRAHDLQRFRDGEFDLVLTNALLMYIGPDRIDQTIRGMLRVARRYLVMIEHHWPEDDSQGAGRFVSGRWMRDYVALLRRCAPHDHVELTKVPAAIWDDEGWRRYGHIVTCARQGSPGTGVGTLEGRG
jgi:SAM-dependent methyltransferase